METNGNFSGGKMTDGQNSNYPSSNRAIVGVILVIIGLFLVLRNTGVFPGFIDHIIFSWPMLLVAIGLVMTLGSSEKTKGVIVMAVGGFFLLPRIFSETFYNYNMFWPSIFIIIGIIFIVSRRKAGGPVLTKGISGDDYIDFVHIFSGGERQIISQNFRGGKLTAIFGGSEIDLTRATLAPGRNTIEIACIFGGTTIIVPDDWNVKLEVTPILGGFNDSRRLISGTPVDPGRQLVITGVVIFGGGEIKSYK